MKNRVQMAFLSGQALTRTANLPGRLFRGGEHFHSQPPAQIALNAEPRYYTAAPPMVTGGLQLCWRPELRGPEQVSNTQCRTTNLS